MIKKLIPLLIPVLALVGGAFAGDMLRAPAESPDAAPAMEGHDAPKDDHAEAGDDHAEAEDHAEPADDHAKAEDDHAAPADDHAKAGGDHGGDPNDPAWFRFPTQFFVPLMRQGDLDDVMILTLTVQTDAASVEAMGGKEHAMRDALLRQLMIHANTGGFDGNFTAERNLAALREGLLGAATASTDLPVTAILIEDIARQPG